MPPPADVFEGFQYNMIRAHHTFKIGYENIMKHLEEKPREVIESDLDNFLGYCYAWVAAIEHHHDSEEQVLFPLLSQKMNFEPEKEAHKVIEKGLLDLEALIKQGKADHSKVDLGKIKKVLSEMKEPLYNHLDEEIEHLKPATVIQSGFSKDEIADIMGRVVKYVQSTGDSSLLVPFMRSHTPTEFKDIWPPMPWVVRKIVVPYVLAWKYSGYWKYSPFALS